MAPNPVARRLSAVLLADVVGYTRLMEANEEGTLAALKEHRREFIDPSIDRHSGRIVNLAGDGALIEFGSVLDAVSCAVDIQRGMVGRNKGIPQDRQMLLRIGITSGDIMYEDDDIYGDGVNLADRLQKYARPGGIACSATVRDQVGSKLDLVFVDQGEQQFKNIKRPVQVYSIEPIQSEVDQTPEGIAAEPSIREFERPSIAVLPFSNIGNEPENEYFSDGITEDIITDLSKVSGLFVIARNSVFIYKGKATRVDQVSNELGVRYVLEGSIRKAGRRIRINVDLIDGATDWHMWAERYDSELDGIFGLQDEIIRKIVDALRIQLLPEERGAISVAPTENVEAYTYCLRGRDFRNRHMKRYYALARKMFAKAADLDPCYAAAYAGMANCDTYLYRGGDTSVSVDDILENSAKAIELDANLAEAHASRGFALSQFGQHREAELEFKASIELDPTLHDAYYFYATYCQIHCNDPDNYERAASLYERAAELRPADFLSCFLLSNIYEKLGRLEDSNKADSRAIERAERAFRSQPENAKAAIYASVSLARQGNTARAKDMLEMALAAEPDDLNIHYNAACAYSRLGDHDKAIESLKQAFLHLIPIRDWVVEDPDLAALHQLPTFKALLRDMDNY